MGSACKICVISGAPHGSARITRVRSDLELARGAPLPGGVAEVWLVSRDALRAHADAFRASLSPEEIERCDRFVRSEDRERYASFHGLLRRVLSLHTGCAPGELRFTKGLAGKPALDPACVRDAPEFNLSHSGDWAAIAIAPNGCPVGIDVEELSREADMLGIARHSFCPGETVALEAASGDVRAALFFRWWTAKEAVVKAWGTGLSGRMDRMNCSGWRDGARASLRDESGAEWALWHYSEGARALSLAVAAPLREIRLCSTNAFGGASGALMTRSS
jgi:4'-phosphopantetheinyl transferase